MIKTRQKNIRAFELSGGTTAEYVNFVVKNFALLKDYLLIFGESIDDALFVTLKELDLTYVVSESELKGGEIRPLEQKSEKTKTNVYARHVRSGEEIRSEGDLLLCGNVNNGARIVSEGCVAIFGKCEGIVECGGEYLLVKTVGSPHVVFGGEILSPLILERINSNDSLKLITKTGDVLSVKEIKQ